MKEKMESDRLLFKDIEDDLNKIYDNVKFTIEMKEINMQSYMQITSEKKINFINMKEITTKYQDKYEIEMLDKIKYQVIKIHFKSF